MGSPTILVAMPTMAWMPSRTATALISMILYDNAHHRYVAGFSECHNTLISEARNEAARRVLDQRAPSGAKLTHLLFVDSDMIPPPDGIQKLVETEADIACGLFTNRTFDSRTTIRPMVFDSDGKGAYKSIDVPQRSYEELEAAGARDVDACGMAFTLIRREVFEKLPAPWFDFTLDPATRKPRGEDTMFCRAAKEAGLSIKCRLSCVVGHIGAFEFNIADAMACQDAAREEQQT